MKFFTVYNITQWLVRKKMWMMWPFSPQVWLLCSTGNEWTARVSLTVTNAVCSLGLWLAPTSRCFMWSLEKVIFTSNGLQRHVFRSGGKRSIQHSIATFCVPILYQEYTDLLLYKLWMKTKVFCTRVINFQSTRWP